MNIYSFLQKAGRVDEKVKETKDSGVVDAFIVAAIDIGTTYSGYAFSFKHEYDKDPTQVDLCWVASRNNKHNVCCNGRLINDKFGYNNCTRYDNYLLHT